MADRLTGRRQRGTALDSLKRLQRLQSARGIPKRNPATGEVSVSPIDLPFTAAGPAAAVGDAIGNTIRVIVSKMAQTAPEKQTGKVSAERKLSNTRRGMGVLKKKEAR